MYVAPKWQSHHHIHIAFTVIFLFNIDFFSLLDDSPTCGC